MGKMARAAEREPSHATSTRRAPGAKEEADLTAARVEAAEYKFWYDKYRGYVSWYEKERQERKHALDTAEVGTEEKKPRRERDGDLRLEASALELQSAQLQALRAATSAADEAKAAAAQQEQQAAAAAAAAAEQEARARQAEERRGEGSRGGGGDGGA
jgi:hypothetical protein